MEYTTFVKKYKDYPKELYKTIIENKKEFAHTKESPFYNFGTMQKDEDIGLSSNIVVANAQEFEKSFEKYKKKNPQISEIEAKSRVVFDFLQENGSDLSFDKNGGDILFGDFDRKTFYADAMYQNAISNTNFFDRHIGNMQMICLAPMTLDQMPRNTEGLSKEAMNKLKDIPAAERLEMFYKRGFYHESIHVAMGTSDERKCDVFSLLKVMKEHPEHAKTVFAVYNMARSKIGYSVETLNSLRNKENTFVRSIKGGAMTYLMPNTYKKMEEYAQNPAKIPSDDAGILKLTCNMTSDTEFSKNQLKDFNSLLHKDKISEDDLKNSEVVQLCMKQGSFDNIDDYIKSDKKLMQFIQKSKAYNDNKKVNIPVLRGVETESNVSKEPFQQTVLDKVSIKYMQDNISNKK